MMSQRRPFADVMPSYGPVNILARGATATAVSSQALAEADHFVRVTM